MALKSSSSTDARNKCTANDDEPLLSLSDLELESDADSATDMQEQQEHSDDLAAAVIPQSSTSVAAKTTLPTTTSSSRIRELLDEELDMHKTIHYAITTMYTTTLNQVQAGNKDGVTEDHKGLAYETAAHVVTVLRRFQNIQDCLEDEGRAETALLLVGYVCDTFSCFTKFCEHYLHGNKSTMVVRSTLRDVALSKYLGELCRQIGESDFANQLNVILKVKESDDSATVYNTRITKNLSACDNFVANGAPVTFRYIPAVHNTWADLQRELLTKFVSACTSIFPANGFRAVANNYIIHAECVLNNLERGNYRAAEKSFWMSVFQDDV